MTIRSDLFLAPNLIMPGVGKCGTTTLHDILVQHPDIAGGFEKELRFLVDNDDDIEHPENIHNYGLSGWIARFPDGGRGPYRYWLDASPQYQAQAIAPKTIAGLNNNPRLIFIVRRPSRRLFSMYQFFRYHMGCCRTSPVSPVSLMRVGPRLARQSPRGTCWSMFWPTAAMTRCSNSGAP